MDLSLNNDTHTHTHTHTSVCVCISIYAKQIKNIGPPEYEGISESS